MNKYIYLDNASTQFMSTQVRQAIVDAPQGNSNSLHDLGLESKKLVKQTEEKILKHINAPNGKIIWTSGGSQANQLACNILSFTHTSPIEHKSILNQKYFDFYTVNKNGYLLPFWIQEGKTSLQLVNNELGTYQKLDDIEPFHSDCVQALGKYKIDVQKLGVESITLSAHKIGGPKGIGCLWVSDKIKDSFEDNHFTLNIPGIAGFNKALDEIDLNSYKEKIDELNNLLFFRIIESDLFQQDKIKFNNTIAIRENVSPIFSIQTPEIKGIDLMMRLNEKGIYVSTGSACNSGEEKPSHVLKAIGLTDEEALSTIRISMSKNNTREEIEEASKILLEIIEELNESNI